MLLELAGYPLRPTRQPGESLAGFVSRHFGTNGHWMPEALHRALSTLYRSEDAPARGEAWELICSLTGQASPVDHQIWVKERFTLPEAAPRRKGRHWQRAYSSKVRVCPHCLAEYGVHLAIWELPLVDVCPRHGGLLVHRCECGNELTWPGMGPDWTCRCSTRRDNASATRRLSRAWNSAAKAATSLALLVCRWPITDQATSSSIRLACLRFASCTLFSPSRRQPAATASRSRADSTVFVTGSSLTPAGFRPADLAARSMRSRIAFSRVANPLSGVESTMSSSSHVGTVRGPGLQWRCAEYRAMSVVK